MRHVFASGAANRWQDQRSARQRSERRISGVRLERLARQSREGEFERMRDALTRIARENEQPKQVEHTVVVRLRRSASRGKLERTGLLGEAKVGRA